MISFLLSWLADKAWAANPEVKVPTTSLPSSGANANEIANHLADYILSVLTYLAYPLGFAAIVYSAYILVSSSGSPDAYAKAKKNVTYLVIGVFLIVFAIIIVNFIIGFFATQNRP